MSKTSVRRFFSDIFGRTDDLHAAKNKHRSRRMKLERLETRDVPSTAIPLNGGTWTEVGPRPILGGEALGTPTATGRFDSIGIPQVAPGVTFDKSYPNLYAASAQGGIWTSVNDGTTWTPRTDKLTATNPVNSATLIRAVQRDSDLNTRDDTVYAASFANGGGFLYFSTDSGATFTQLGVTAFNQGRRITEFIVIPGATQATDLIYAAVVGSPMAGPSGIYRSIDGGVNWTNITAVGFPFAQVSGLVFSDVDVDPTNKEVLYATVNADPATQSAVGVYRCTNAFSTPGTAGPTQPAWQLRLGGGTVFSATLPTRLQTVVAPNLPSTLFVSVAAGGIYGVYQSNDTGINWTPNLTTSFGGAVPDYGVASGAGFGGTYSRIMVDPTSPLNPNQQIVFAGGAGDDDDGSQTINNQFIRSANSATSWTNLTFNGDGTPGMVYFGIRDMGFDRMNRVVVATEGGLFRLEPSALIIGTTVWKSLNGKANAGNNNGTGAINTTQVNAFGQAIHPFDPNQAFINDGPFHSAAKFNNLPAWQTMDSRTAPWFHVNPVPLPHFSEQTGNANAFYDFNTPTNMLRVGNGGVRRSIDGGATWDFANVPFASAGAFVSDPSDSRRYYSANPGDDVYIYDLPQDATATLEAFLGFRLPSLDFFPIGANPGTVTAIGVSRQSNLIYVATTPGIYESEIQTDPPGAPIPAVRSRLFVISPNGIPNAAGIPTFAWVELSLPVAVSGNTAGTIPPDRIDQIIVDPNNPFNVFFKTQGAQTIYNMRSASINWMAPPPQPNPGPPTFMGPNPVLAIATVNWQQINPTAAGSQPPTFTKAQSTGVTVMTYDPNIGTNSTDDVIYIGTNYGVYSHPINRTQTNNFIWTRVGADELPNNAVRDLDINTTTGVLSVGLNGRGVWQFQIRTLVQGQVFTDFNGDGNVNTDPVQPGIVVELVDASVTPNQVVATTVSDANGFYFFRSVPAGTYSVRTNLPANLVRTTQDVAPFTVNLRDVVFPTPIPAPPVTPPLTTYRDGMNIGVFQRGSIRGIKFEDLNQNGVKEPGENGVPGFTIYIDANNNGTFDPTDPSSVTDTSGNFSFLNLGPAFINGIQQLNTTAPTYFVREVQQAGWQQTAPAPGPGGFFTLAINSNSQITGIQFGNFRAGAISGVKFLDANSNGRFDAGETGLANWRFFVDANGNNIFDATETNVLTDANGVFQFLALPAGTYRIREQQQAGFIQTTANPADIVLTGTNSVNNLLFGNVTLADFRLINGWTPIGPQPQLNGSGIGNPTVSGRVNSITTDPTNPNRYFIATAGGGIWRTLNGGGTWTPLTDNIPGLTPFQVSPYTDSIYMSPSNPNVIYAAQGDSPGGTPGHGILKSTDGGTTWTLLQGPGNAFAFSVVPQLIVDKNDSNLVFAAISGGGVMRTTDGGLNWTSISAGDPLVAGRFFSDIQIDPFNSNVVYAAAGGIYRTSNALSANPTWTLLIGGSAFVPGSLPGNIRLAIAKSQPSTIYAAIARTPDADGKSRYLATYKSSDSGVNWTNLVNAPDYMGTQGDYDLAIEVSPTNPNVVIATGVGTGFQQSTNLVVMSNDGGITWRDGIAGSGAVLGPHTDSHDLAFDSSGRLLIATDGGMFRLNNATLPAPTLIPPFNGAIPNWVSLNGAINVPGALNTIQFVGIATHPTDANKVAGGSQDNGLALFTGNIAWDTKAGGDRGETVWDFDRPNNVYNIAPIASVGPGNYVSKSIDGGNTWADATNGIQGQTTQNTLFYPDLIIDPNNSMRLFTGTDKVWVTDDGAANWSQTTKYDNVVDVMIPDTPLSGMTPPIPIVTIGVTRAPDTILYVSQGGALFRIQLFFPFPTPPATTDWVDVSPPGGGVSKIIMDPTSPNTIIVVAGGTIWRSTNFGGTWTPLDGAILNPNRLPAVGTNTLALDTRIATDPADDILYAGTEDGVYALFNPTNPNVSWFRVGDQNLPNTSVRDLDLNTTTGILSAATYGRGVWQTRIRGTIQGQVFEDLNGNGNFDGGEPVQAGITVRLLDATPGGSNGAELATTVTDALGRYQFQSLRAGNYRVVQTSPTGQVQTTANPADLFNFTEQSLATPVFTGTVVPGITVDIRYIFGNFRTGNVSGVKFEDRNNNAVRDAGEPGLVGFVIFSDLNGDGIRQWTDLNSNNVFDVGEGERWTTSAADGSYLLTGFGPPVLMGVPQTPPPFSIREIQQANFTQTSPNPTPFTVLSGQNFSGVNFGNIRNGRLAGAIFNDLTGNGIRDAGDPGVPNATLNLIDTATGSIIRTIQSDTAGNYTFFSLAPGTYEIREVVPTGWIQTKPVAPLPTFYTATIIGGGQLGGFEFGNFKLFTVSGVKFEDSNGDGIRQGSEAGVPGFTIRLTNTGTSVVTNAVTDAFGNYSFPNIGPGNYSIAEVQKAGWTQTSATPANFQGISATNRTSLNFGNFRFINATGVVFNDVNGNGIRDNGEVGIGGISVRLDRGNDGVIDNTALTDGNGVYSFPTLGPGSYRITTAPRKGFVITTPPGGAYVFSAVSSTNPTGLDFGVRSANVEAVGQDAGAGPLVTVRNPLTKQELFSFLAYTPSFRGGVRVATGYINGTTSPQVVTAPGPGGGPHVRVFNSQTAVEEWGFFAYTAGFTGGVYVAAGDVNGDGFDDIVTAAGAGGGPHIRVWSGQTHLELFGFFAYDSRFSGGVRVAVADVNGDGKGDIITGAGPGGGPHVKVFSGANLAVLQSFFAFDASFTGGVFVAGGDFTKDGKADIAVSADAGGGSHARIFNGVNLAIVSEVFGFESSFRGGTRVAVMDTNFDNNLDLVLGAGPGRRPEVSDFTLVNGSLQKINTFTAFDPTFLGGVFVG